MSNESDNNKIDRRYHICGYARLGIEQGDGSYGAGFSMYSAAWPMLDTYPGHDFQSGLFGTWMHPDSEDPKLEGVWFYNTIEGGLGWWRDTRFPTLTPKFTVPGPTARARARAMIGITPKATTARRSSVTPCCGRQTR